jgi:hypothetical protein
MPCVILHVVRLKADVIVRLDQDIGRTFAQQKVTGFGYTSRILENNPDRERMSPSLRRESLARLFPGLIDNQHLIRPQRLRAKSSSSFST